MNNNSTLDENTDANMPIEDESMMVTEFSPDVEKGYASILLCSGPIASLSRLVLKGKFKKIKIGGESGAAAVGKHLFKNISEKGLGQLVYFRVRKNSTNVNIRL